MKLFYYCKISGSSVKKFDGSKKYIATGDVVDNQILTYETVDYNNKPSRANVEIVENDILFAKMKDTRKVLLGNKENASNIYSTGFYVLKANEGINPKYIYYYLNTDSFNNQKDKNCSGATQKALNNEGLNKIVIKNIPDISIQNKIINEMDYIKSLIGIKNKEIKKLEELIKSQFVRFNEVELCM